jgi:cell division protein FtsW (lipid II flippase)
MRALHLARAPRPRWLELVLLVFPVLLLATGLTTIIGVQAFIIIGGVIRVVPLTGITLPFVSYGGSSVVASFLMVGLLLSISHRTAVGAEAETPQ